MTKVNFDPGSLLELALELGRKNLRVMERRDAGHVEAFGDPFPAAVPVGTKPGPASW